MLRLLKRKDVVSVLWRASNVKRIDLHDFTEKLFSLAFILNEIKKVSASSSKISIIQDLHYDCGSSLESNNKAFISIL